jgi:hypothetical protein
MIALILSLSEGAPGREVGQIGEARNATREVGGEIDTFTGSRASA